MPLSKEFICVLPTGKLSVTSPSEQDFNELFGVAQRRNPKRAFLFVSKVLGRHIPVSPKIMRKTYQTLASKIPHDLPQPVLFVGMAETAVGLAAGVFDESKVKFGQSVLLTSTRHEVDGSLMCEFKENHSHATDHLIYWPEKEALKEIAKNARSLVLIDDEATTGNTFTNLYAALLKAGLEHLEKLVTVTLTDWSDDALSKNLNMPVLNVSMATGQWKWEPNVLAEPPLMPNVNVTARGRQAIVAPQDWGRLGTSTAVSHFGEHIKPTPTSKTLVLGTSEFVWPAFLLAERLEREGVDVLYSTTSRSPISVGHAIQSAMTFSDNYGLGIPNFAYNIAHLEFDRVYVCCETGENSIDPHFLAQLNEISPYVEVLHE